jgi:hypothetical protein
MMRIYLDQNKWVDLMWALDGNVKGEQFHDAAQVVVSSVEEGLASFPLSQAHVFETWKARRAERRQPLANAMAAISRNHALAPPWELLPAELDRAFQSRFGRPLVPMPLQPFGWGMRHRSGQEDLQLSSEIRESLLAANPGLSERELTEALDATLLSGPSEDLPTGDIQQPPLQFAEAFAREERAQAERFVNHGSHKDERRRAVAARVFIDMHDAVNGAQGRALVTADDILDLGADGLTDLILDLPSRAGLLELLWQQHDNAQTRWHPNDFNDIIFLSVAVGYCDVVVTERKWAHMFGRTELPKRFGTTVIADLSELTELMVRARPNIA